MEILGANWWLILVKSIDSDNSDASKEDVSHSILTHNFAQIASTRASSSSYDGASALNSFVYLVVFSYLPLEKVVHDIRPLSVKILKSLRNSFIASVNKKILWTIDSEVDCLLH